MPGRRPAPDPGPPLRTGPAAGPTDRRREAPIARAAARDSVMLDLIRLGLSRTHAAPPGSERPACRRRGVARAAEPYRPGHTRGERSRCLCRRSTTASRRSLRRRCGRYSRPSANSCWSRTGSGRGLRSNSRTAARARTPRRRRRAGPRNRPGPHRRPRQHSGPRPRHPRRSPPRSPPEARQEARQEARPGRRDRAVAVSGHDGQRQVARRGRGAGRGGRPADLCPGTHRGPSTVIPGAVRIRGPGHTCRLRAFRSGAGHPGPRRACPPGCRVHAHGDCPGCAGGPRRARAPRGAG